MARCPIHNFHSAEPSDCGENPEDINLITLNTPDRTENQMLIKSPVDFYSINAKGDLVQELGSNSFDFDNGILPNNPDKEIEYEDQNGGICDLSNHCPSNANLAQWLPKLKEAVKEVNSTKKATSTDSKPNNAQNSQNKSNAKINGGN